MLLSHWPRPAASMKAFVMSEGHGNPEVWCGEERLGLTKMKSKTTKKGHLGVKEAKPRIDA